MTTKPLAVVLIALLSGNCFGRTQSSQQPTPQEQVRAIEVNSPVEVRFLNGARLRGRIGEMSKTGFVLTHERRRQLTKSQVAFDQVRTVRQVQSIKPSHRVRYILIGVGITLAAGLIVGLSLATYGRG